MVCRIGADPIRKTSVFYICKGQLRCFGQHPVFTFGEFLFRCQKKSYAKAQDHSTDQIYHHTVRDGDFFLRLFSCVDLFLFCHCVSYQNHFFVHASVLLPLLKTEIQKRIVSIPHQTGHRDQKKHDHQKSAAHRQGVFAVNIRLLHLLPKPRVHRKRQNNCR